LQIKWYGVIIATSMLIAVLISMKCAKKRGLTSDDIISLALLVIPFSIVFARLYYVIFSGRTYTFWEIFKVWEGGMAIYGGLIGGAIAIAIFCKWKKKNFLDFADIIVPSLILAQAIGRWGNFANQEAYGLLVTNQSMQWFPFAVFIEAEGAWHLATFFYESLWNLIGFAVLLKVLWSNKSRGIVTASYFVFYGTGRFWIEGLRTDSLFWGNVRVSQLLSAFLVVAGVVWLTIIIMKNIKTKKQLKGEKQNAVL
ncbi:MAG: prolipoprotein diacylglyceryl transferase, partial [Clostridia bacterium]